jgi:hypothetical protein
MKYLKQTLSILIFFFAFTVVAQEDKEISEQEKQAAIEKAAQNPIASMYVLPFQNNTQFGIGPDDRTQNVLNFQPVIPLSISKKTNLIVRTIIPIISQPVYIPTGDEEKPWVNERKNGLGDIALSLFFTPAKPGKLIWGVGPAIGLPTATDLNTLGTGKWSAGPAIIALIQPTGWTIGLTVQNTWSFAGVSDRADINAFFMNAFIVKNLPKGWYVNSAPIITSNWNAESGEQWLVPLGLGAGKVFKVGKLPINAQIGYYNYVIAPTNGPDWQLRTQINFLFPK